MRYYHIQYPMELLLEMKVWIFLKYQQDRAGQVKGYKILAGQVTGCENVVTSRPLYTTYFMAKEQTPYSPLISL